MDEIRTYLIVYLVALDEYVPIWRKKPVVCGLFQASSGFRFALERGEARFGGSAEGRKRTSGGRGDFRTPYNGCCARQTGGCASPPRRCPRTGGEVGGPRNARANALIGETRPFGPRPLSRCPHTFSASLGGCLRKSARFAGGPRPASGLRLGAPPRSAASERRPRPLAKGRPPPASGRGQGAPAGRRPRGRLRWRLGAFLLPRSLSEY
jgi:hypothetical protein